MEVCLILAVLLLFIITDSRTIKYIAQTSLDSSGLNYENIEGNLFDGLEIQQLSYKNKPLFASALIHWNPLTLFYDKITITKLDAKGIEVDNIITMLNNIQSKESDKIGALDFTITLNDTHFDINPYVYKKVKFSSFVFETGKIDIDKNLSVNAKTLYLKFDSDIVNVKMKGTIKENNLLIDTVNLKNISTKEITKLIHQLKSNNKKAKTTQKTENNLGLVKEIKIKHIFGSMKPVQYGHVKIKGATLNLYDTVIDTANNFTYQVKKIDFKGKTNFGNLDYRGYVKDANIYAKGDIILDKKLFTHYDLPLNFKALEKLPSSLHLNHEAVWIDIDHKVQKLLEIQNNFNLDLSKAKHKIHYNYSDEVLSINSEVKGKMTYANAFELKSKVIIDKKGFSYTGNTLVLESKALAPVITNYLFPSFKGEFKGDRKNFKMLFTSNLFNGILKIKEYKTANLAFKSNTNNINLAKISSDIPKVLKDEFIALEGKGTFDFKNFKNSKIDLLAQSTTLDIEAKMKLEKPLEIHFMSTIHNDLALREILPKLKFSEFKNLKGSIKLEDNHYLINITNKKLKFFLNYNTKQHRIGKAVLNIDHQEFSVDSNQDKKLVFQTKIFNIQGIFEKFKRYYDLEVPNIQGEVDLQIEEQNNNQFWINIKSPKLQYLSESSVDLSILNFYNIDTTFQIDNNLNIEIENYQFKLDENGYLNSFFSDKISSLVLEDKNLKINKLWLNDNIEIRGNYNIENLKGKLEVDTHEYALNTKDFALRLGLDLEVKLNREQINIEGDINILGDTIRYEVVGSDIVEDADIIIMEEMVREQESAFNNLKFYLKIKSKKPLKYIAANINIAFLNELSLLKNYNQKMLLTGVTTVTNGYYELEDKKFILDESHLYFTGDIKTPLLDIKANYEKDEYNIHIFISGTTDSPIVNFNSEPYLTQQEILSLILFDGTGSSSGKGAEAYTLLGGTFAKGLIKSLGIDVDHLLLGTDSQEQLSLEVGRRISKDVSVLYLHKDGLDGVKVKVEHSKSFETDIIIQPPNTSSIEFLYKQDR
ncbi:MAG: Unknown protein [uncultured Sulfurovum sp.]|uniref:Translocation and assembly module TamB C-terminal domain-containing protein n=1 Tax=uncultured Sulfurovum sp. TaxID=269237 RepID=A0A6S6U9P1_9BACT|nr:MAG: Unknown protein [uncultured Sulfurovum sp.]